MRRPLGYSDGIGHQEHGAASRLGVKARRVTVFRIDGIEALAAALRPGLS